MEKFEGVYRACFQDVYLYLKKLTQDEKLAEELTSDAFFRAMRSLDSFRGDCEMRVWLCQIAKNCYFDHCRRQKRIAAEQPPVETSPSPESEIILRCELGDIHRHLHALPEPYKEVFMLRVFGELSPSQIGSLFGRSANWACVVYHRARTMIRKKMEEEK